METVTRKLDDEPNAACRTVLVCHVGPLRLGVDVGEVSEVVRELPLEVPFPGQCAALGLTTLRGRTTLVVDLARSLSVDAARPLGQGRLVALRDSVWSRANEQRPGSLAAGDAAARASTASAPPGVHASQAVALRVDVVETVAELQVEPDAELAGLLRAFTSDQPVGRLPDGPLIPVLSLSRVVTAAVAEPEQS